MSGRSEDAGLGQQRACGGDILEMRGDRAERSPVAGEEDPMGDLLWPVVIVTFVGVVFLLIVSFIRIALADHDSSAEPAATPS
jgi:hypothetical protein